MMNWKGTLRTNSSERFLGFKDGKEVAAVGLHHLANGHYFISLDNPHSSVFNMSRREGLNAVVNYL